MTQRELAVRAGLSLRAISGLERERRRAPRDETLLALAAALDLPPDERAVFTTAGRQRRVPPATPPLVLLPPPAPLTPGVAPDLEASDERGSVLASPPTPLLGRARELAEVTALLRRDGARLVTLTGPGGVGKTRLGLAVAQALRESGDAFPDGVWLVRLESLTDPNLVIPSIGRALGLSEIGGARIADIVRAHLRGKSLLIVLDNFEHVAEAAPQVAELLEWSMGLRLLVTSRAPLRLRAEDRYPVSLLAAPPNAPHQPCTAALLEEYAASALFLQRARAAQPGFQATDASAPAVAAICARLDGLPLAIEVVAAWTRLLPPPALLARLERRQPLPAGGPLDLPARQQTLDATIAWSYDLLAPEERLLFRRLAVFADGCALEAAERVCQHPAGAQPLDQDILAGLGRLLDQNLIVQREENGEPRFSMLHVVREFALERLEATGEAEPLRRAHARYCAELAERLEPALRGPDEPAWLLVVERELSALRAALAWAWAQAEIEVGLRIATALWRFWFDSGHHSEGLGWIEALLALETSATAPGLPQWLRARALASAGALSALRLDLARAAPYLEQAVALGRASGDWRALSLGLEMMGALLRARGDRERAARCFEETLALGRAHGDPLTVFTPLTSLGQIAHDRGDLDGAAARYTEALAVSRSAGHRDHEGAMLRRLGELALVRGDNADAARLLREAVTTFRAAGKLWPVAITVDLLAVAYARTGHETQAARLLGAGSRLRETTIMPYPLSEQARIDALVAPTRAALSAGIWADAFAAGRTLTLEEVATEAVEPPPEMARGMAEGGPGAEREPAAARAAEMRPGSEELTRRELEVLRLLAQGWTDAQIAHSLVISTRTVNHHVAAIYSKLGVSSRAAATRAALDGRLL